MAEKIVPDLMAFLACRDCKPDQTGMVSIHGIFAGVKPPCYPSRMDFKLVTIWLNGTGKFQMDVRILDSSDVVIWKGNQEFELKEYWLPQTTAFNVDNLELVKPGDYPVEVRLDGDLKSRFRIKFF